MPNAMQCVAFVLGIYGAMVLVIPEIVAKVLCPCWYKKLHSNQKDQDKYIS